MDEGLGAISRSDLDSLMTLYEIIGLAMMYTQLFQAAQSFKEALAVLPGLTR